MSHDRALERLERRVRLLAMEHVSRDRVEAVVRRTLAEVAAGLREGLLPRGPGLAAAAYEIARSRIDESASPETFRVAALLIEREDRSEVAGCLERLDECDREILRRAFAEGRSPAEIAMAEGCTPEEVRRRKQGAVDRFLELYRPSSKP